MTPNKYIESLYEKQGHKIVCTSVELDLSYSATKTKMTDCIISVKDVKAAVQALENAGVDHRVVGKQIYTSDCETFEVKEPKLAQHITVREKKNDTTYDFK